MKLSLVLALVTGLTVFVAAKVTPATRTKPMKSKTYSDDEWQKVLERIAPRIDDRNAAAQLERLPGAGKLSKGITPSIVGGSEAILGQFPWQVYLFFDDSKMCGGSLIQPKWVLTAAHCIGTTHQVTLGTINTASPSEGSVVKTPMTVIKHEDYNDATLANDIALLELPEEVTLTNNIKLIALPPMTDASKSFAGTLATVSGWGKTESGESSEALKSTQLTVIEQTECVLKFPELMNSQICTFQTGTSDCEGDSGGPLVYKDATDTMVQIGVVSFGGDGGCLAGPSVFARTSSYLGWISTKIGKDMSGTTTPAPTTTPTTTKPTTKATGSTKKTTTKKTTTTTTPKPLKCADVKFEGMGKCCGIPPIELVTTKDKICEANAAKIKYFNTYNLNKLQVKANNTLDFNHPSLKSTLGQAAMDKVDNGTVNVTLLTEFLVKSQKKWAPAMSKIASTCESLVANLTIPSYKIDGVTYSAKPVVFIQCIQFAIIAKCPTNKCPKKDVTNFKKCAETIFQGLADKVGEITL